MKQKKVFVLFIAICMLSITFSTSSSQAKTVSGTEYLTFGEYVYMSATVREDAEIEWAFAGSNPYVGIVAMAMTEYNFQKFDSGDLSAYAYFLSDGGYYADYGTFRARSDDTWYIVYWNIDAVVESSTVEYETKFPGSAGLIVGIIIGAIVVAAIIGGIIYSVNKKKKAGQVPAAGQPSIYQPYAVAPPVQPIQQPYAPPAQPAPEVAAAKVCTNCGASMDGKFCTNCGAKI